MPIVFIFVSSFVRKPAKLCHVTHLRVEEDLRAEELLVADVDLEGLLGDGVDAAVLLDVLVGVGVELVELFGDVGADVAVALLDGLGRLQRLLRRDPDLALAQQALQNLKLLGTLGHLLGLSYQLAPFTNMELQHTMQRTCTYLR